MLRLIRAFFAPSTKPDLDEGDVSAFAFANKILELQKQIEDLKQENVKLTDAIYECEGRMMEKIDRIQPVIYNIASKENHQ
jgi:hypothetical protein